MYCSNGRKTPCHGLHGGMQILYTLAALDVPAALHSGPKTADELAPIVGACCCEDGKTLPIKPRSIGISSSLRLQCIMSLQADAQQRFEAWDASTLTADARQQGCRTQPSWSGCCAVPRCCGCFRAQAPLRPDSPQGALVPRSCCFRTTSCQLMHSPLDDEL